MGKKKIKKRYRVIVNTNHAYTGDFEIVGEYNDVAFAAPALQKEVFRRYPKNKFFVQTDDLGRPLAFWDAANKRILHPYGYISAIDSE